MRNRFIPGANKNFNNKKLYTYSLYQAYNQCNCFQDKFDNIQTSTNNPTQSQSMRISQLVSNNLGGKISYGNFGIPVIINYLGRTEGQSGGSGKPLRNKF